MSIDCSAEDNTILRTSAQQIHGLYGDTIGISYSLGNVQHTATAEFVASVCSTGNYGQVHCDYNGSNLDPDSFYSADYMDYDCIFYLVRVATGETVINDITVTGLDTYFTGYARGAFLGEAAGLVSGLTPDWNKISLWPDNYAGDFLAVCGNYASLPELANYYGFTQIRWNYDITIPFRAVPYEFTDGGSITDIHFDSLCSDRYGNLIIGVVCPFYGGSVAVTPPGTTTTTATTTTTTQTDINVNVNIDLNQTNGILGSIRDLIANLGAFIVNGVKGLFLPDQDDITNWKQTIVTILYDTFGGIPELENQLKNAITAIFTASARQTVTFKGIKVPAAAGEPEAIIVPEQEVALRPPGFDNLFNWSETFINIVATIAVANTCFNQIKRIVVGEVVVDAD